MVLKESIRQNPDEVVHLALENLVKPVLEGNQVLSGIPITMNEAICSNLVEPEGGSIILVGADRSICCDSSIC